MKGENRETNAQGGERKSGRKGDLGEVRGSMRKKEKRSAGKKKLLENEKGKRKATVSAPKITERRDHGKDLNGKESEREKGHSLPTLTKKENLMRKGQGIGSPRNKENETEVYHRREKKGSPGGRGTNSLLPLLAEGFAEGGKNAGERAAGKRGLGTKEERLTPKRVGNYRWLSLRTRLEEVKSTAHFTRGKVTSGRKKGECRPFERGELDQENLSETR